MLLQTEGVGGRRHWNPGAIPRFSFPIQRPDAAAGEAGGDGDRPATAAGRVPTPTPDAGTLDRPVTVRLQQPRRPQLCHRSVNSLSDAHRTSWHCRQICDYFCTAEVFSKQYPYPQVFVNSHQTSRLQFQFLRVVGVTHCDMSLLHL